MLGADPLRSEPGGMTACRFDRFLGTGGYTHRTLDGAGLGRCYREDGILQPRHGQSHPSQSIGCHSLHCHETEKEVMIGHNLMSHRTGEGTGFSERLLGPRQQVSDSSPARTALGSFSHRWCCRPIEFPGGKCQTVPADTH
jgi:hypothetical protein